MRYGCWHVDCSGKQRLALWSFLFEISRLGGHEASCQSTNALKGLKVHHQLHDCGNTGVSAGNAQVVSRLVAQPPCSGNMVERSLQCAGVGWEDT